MEKTLDKVLHCIDHKLTQNDGSTEISDSGIIQNVKITSLVFDSRDVKEGSLFFALPGTHTTGNRFISQAILNGAAAVIFQDDFSSEEKDSIQKAMEQKNAETVFIRVESSRRAMSPVSSAFYDNPSSKLVIYGVTGTEGKSSTVSFIWQLLTLSGYKAGFISTVQYSLGGPAINNPEHQTTPEAPIVQRELYEMVQNGCTHAVVESSSHGLSDKLNRLGDVLFDCAVFMNVTLEHLEFHGTFEQYRNDKANLFRALDRHNHIKTIQGKEVEVPSFGIVNLEDESFPFFVSATNKKVIGYTTEGKAGKQAGEEEQQVSPLPSIPEDMAYLSARNIASARFGLSFSIHRFQDHDSIKNENRVIHVKAPLPGAFNAYNIMAALLAVNGTTGISLEDLSAKATELVPVKGRMTVIDQGQPFEVIVDYAHTPSSFETIFPPLRKRCTGRMIALFGSGGERDIKKRPLQGQVAARFCDILVLTDEDPRQEDSMSILNMIADGAEKEGKIKDKDMFLISDRMEAIKKAFAIAQKDDIVLLLGKSHENSIIFKDRVMPYDEISQAKKTLEEMGYKENKK